MSIDLTGITNKNEYYTNHYFSTIFEKNTSTIISGWNVASKESKEIRTPWSLLRNNARQYYTVHDKYVRSSDNLQVIDDIKSLADSYLKSLGYPEAKPEVVKVDDSLSVPVYLEITKNNGAPLLWVLLSTAKETDAGIMESFVFNADYVDEDTTGTINKGIISEIANEELVTNIFFGFSEPPRFVILIGMNQIALIDRNKWSEKRYLQFELDEIFSRMEDTTLKAMSVLLHKDSLCPDEGKVILDELDEESKKNASGVSKDLKYALRESIELLGNEVLYDMKTRLGRDLDVDPVDSAQLTLECLRYMYRMLFVLFIESRPELGYAPIKAQSYYSAYSLESLRDIADNIRDDIDEVGSGYYLHETLTNLYNLIYDGYPTTEEEFKKVTGSESLHDIFFIAPLKAHIFDYEYTKMITEAKIRNSCMLRIIDLMSLTRASGKKNVRRGRISYANLGINQMGSVYEALLSYRGFIAEQDLYEVKRSKDSFNELDVGYFVSESELDQYSEEERVRYEHGEKKGKLRMYEKGYFIYRLAGREREKSASYYTPEVLTKCLVKYALKELLEGKNADDILKLTICEPAMGSAAFLNEAINQLAEAYISRKEKETGEIISYDKRFKELQKVKMFIADRNVYGIDLNPVAVELAEVSLWLNTIYEGGFVPWFGTQLVNGNSLIGARRQVYTIENIQATSKGMRWYEKEPERLSFGTNRSDKQCKFKYKRIYHFLLGDPGMCSYSDKVIKSLEPDKIKKMMEWNKKFIEPISDDDAITLLRLSRAIDKLWESQIELRKVVGDKTQDTLSIFGHIDDVVDSHTTIRQKDKIYRELYKSEHMKNAGPYARLKFAMDYWCALWFWPIDKVNLLPSRSEFLFDMFLILEGTMASANLKEHIKSGQMSMFLNEMEQMAMDIIDTYGVDTVVDIPRLREENPRLDLVAKIAEQNKFMHWELEFADLFANRGGFDLIIGNPPWVKMKWNEQDALSDKQPLFALKNYSAAQTAKLREKELINFSTRDIYFSEYENMAGIQAFLSATQNYPILKGTANLYKCFLPQAFMFSKKDGVSAFIHPEGVYNDPKGGLLRDELYKRLRYHFQFVNELKLFEEVHHHTVYSLNVYTAYNEVKFDSISNLYASSTIDESYSTESTSMVPGMKDEKGWCIIGHPERIIHISKQELSIFANLFERNENGKEPPLPVIHAKVLIEVLKKFEVQEVTIGDMKNDIFSTEMWNETSAQKNDTIVRNVHFPETLVNAIVSGPHFGIANPMFKVSRSICKVNSDYDSIDITFLDENYIQRCNYEPQCTLDEYNKRAPSTKWETKCYDYYRIFIRNMFNQNGERTLISAIMPPKVGHVNAVFELGFRDEKLIPLVNGLMSSLPYDFYIKSIGKDTGGISVFSVLPIVENKYSRRIALNALLLNCLTSNYSSLWKMCWQEEYVYEQWSKRDSHLSDIVFSKMSEKWSAQIPLRSDFERRYALVEIDVLTAMALGMSLNQLKNIYRIQFPVLQSYELDTWYDANGRIVFTNNRSLLGVGFNRKEWENELKEAPAGKKFYRTIMDDTMPGGPVERTIEYVAPFERCDREKDYEIAWKFFEEKYKGEE